MTGSLVLVDLSAVFFLFTAIRGIPLESPTNEYNSHFSALSFSLNFYLAIRFILVNKITVAFGRVIFGDIDFSLLKITVYGSKFKMIKNLI